MGGPKIQGWHILRGPSSTALRPEVSEMNPTALLLLVLAIASEVAGTAGLKASEGFGRLGPSALALVGYALAFYFLAQSLKYIPLGVAYAIWSGLGTVGSVLLGLLIWKEILGPMHIFGIALIVVGVVLLNVAPST
jgi:multidrug transporter EmrE-like cation transporter